MLTRADSRRTLECAGRCHQPPRAREGDQEGRTAAREGSRRIDSHAAQFNSYDKNKNGTIEADELALLGKDLQKLLGAGHHDSDEWKNEARAMSPDDLVKKWMDKNGDKSVSYDEFKAFINSLAHK